VGGGGPMGLTSTGLVNTGLVNTGLVNTGLVNTGAAELGPANTGSGAATISPPAGRNPALPTVWPASGNATNDSPMDASMTRSPAQPAFPALAIGSARQ